MLIQNNTGTVAPPAPQTQGRASDSAPVGVSLPDAPSGAPAAPAHTASPATLAQLQGVVDSINRTLQQSSSSQLEFSVDTGTNQTVIKVVESGTGTVIRQYPSEETLAIARSIDHIQQGLLLNQKA